MFKQSHFLWRVETDPALGIVITDRKGILLILGGTDFETRERAQKLVSAHNAWDECFHDLEDAVNKLDHALSTAGVA